MSEAKQVSKILSEEQLAELRSLVEKLFEIEARGRDIASRSDVLDTVKEAEEYFDRANTDLTDLFYLLSLIRARLPPDISEKIKLTIVLSEIARNSEEALEDLERAKETIATTLAEIHRASWNKFVEGKHEASKVLDELYNRLREIADKYILKHRAREVTEESIRKGIEELSKLFSEYCESKEFEKLVGSSTAMSICGNLSIAQLGLSYSVESFDMVSKGLDVLDDLCKEVFGSRCTWLRGVKTPYTLSALVNDFSASVHRLAESLREDLMKLGEVRGMWVGRIFVMENTDERLIEFAKVLSKAWEYGDKSLIYAPEDAEALGGICYDNKCELRVGSAEGHRTHVTLRDSEVKVEYYDTDDDVNQVMKKLLEEFGACSCSIEFETGVFCTCPADRLRDVALVLSLATSMDYRIFDKAKWGTYLNLVEECREKVRNDIEWEVCISEKYIEELRKHI